MSSQSSCPLLSSQYSYLLQQRLLKENPQYDSILNEERQAENWGRQEDFMDPAVDDQETFDKSNDIIDKFHVLFDYSDPLIVSLSFVREYKMAGGSRPTAKKMFQTLLPKMSELKEGIHVIKAKQLFVQCISTLENKYLITKVKMTHEQLTEKCKHVYDERSKDKDTFNFDSALPQLQSMALQNMEKSMKMAADSVMMGLQDNFEQNTCLMKSLLSMDGIKQDSMRSVMSAFMDKYVERMSFANKNQYCYCHW